MRSYIKADIRKPEILENFYHVLIEEGFEGASINKIARRMNIHPSLIIHYFKTKENLTIALADYLIEKYEAPGFLDDVADESSVVTRMGRAELEARESQVEGRMKRKMLALRNLFEAGAASVIIADGRVEHPLRDALDGRGTVIE